MIFKLFVVLALAQCQILASNVNLFDEKAEVEFTVLWQNMIQFKNALAPAFSGKLVLNLDQKALILKTIVEFIDTNTRLIETAGKTRGKTCVLKIVDFMQAASGVMNNLLERKDSELQSKLGALGDQTHLALGNCF
jgi:hypothetical protein